MELFSEQQTSRPNRLILPIVTLWILSDPFQHFLNFFPFSRCLFLGFFGGLTTSSISLLSFALGLPLGGYNNKYVRGIRFNIKEPSTGFEERSTSSLAQQVA
jgi:hypothetical protein